MDIYVIRHATALEREAPILDQHRPLTARGRKDARRLGKLLRREEVELDAVVTSPLVRAVETASQIVVGLDFDGALEVAPELSPGVDAAGVVREVLMPRADLDAVAVVGHEPQLSALLELLLRERVPGPGKASAIRLRWFGPEEPAKFKWVLRPEFDRPSKELADIV